MVSFLRSSGESSAVDGAQAESLGEARGCRMMSIGIANWKMAVEIVDFQRVLLILKIPISEAFHQGHASMREMRLRYRHIGITSVP